MLLLTGVALLQSVLFARVGLWGARFDLMFLVVLIWAVVRGPDEGLVWGFIGGLLIDMLSGGPMGATPIALVLVALFAGQGWGQGIGSPAMRVLLLALAGGLIHHLAVLLLMAWTGHTLDWGYLITRVTVPSVLLNVALAPLVHMPLAWLERKTRREGFGL